MRTLIGLLLLVAWSVGATSYTEFYVDVASANGTNVNAGSTSGAATFSAVSGSWVQSTRVWTLAGSDLSAVTTNMWASVYPDGLTNAVFVGRITAVDDTLDTVTISGTQIAGTSPVDGTANTSLRVGGAWHGPYGTVGFPFNFATYTLTNISGNVPCVNWKGGSSNVITAAMTHSLIGPIRWEGYTNSVHDGGKAICFDGGTSGVSYVGLADSGADQMFVNLRFQNNGASGTANGVSSTGARNIFSGCVFNNFRGAGLALASGNGQMLGECEAFGCNAGGASFTGGFLVGATATLFRCVSHDNTTSTASGFVTSGGLAIFDSCIAWNNGQEGISFTTAPGCVYNSICYSNASDGIDLLVASVGSFYVENSLLFKNKGLGINNSGSVLLRNGAIRNCVYGSGTQTNLLGNVISTLQGIDQDTPIIYSTDNTPWVDPVNGNFTTIIGATTINAARALFTQINVNSPTNTVSYPDIGATQFTNAASFPRFYNSVFAQ